MSEDFLSPTCYGGGVPVVVDDRYRTLLEGLLLPIRRARATPLQFEIDSGRIVEAALEGLSLTDEGLGREEVRRDRLPDELDRVVAEALGISEEMVGRARRSVAGEAPPSEGEARQLARWLDGFFQLLRSVDHRAIELMAMRLEGASNRDIAERQESGLRLVNRILGEIRAAWTANIGRG